MTGIQNPLHAQIRSVGSLSERERDAMFALLSRYYSHVDRETFLRDLNQKSEVILLRDQSGQKIRGFSTLLFFEAPVLGRMRRGVFSGDTVIEEAFWGQTALQRAFVRRLIQEKLKRPFSPLFWFLISKGYKTYLLMANNFTSYYPSMEGYRGGLSEESNLKAVAHAFARNLFGGHFVPQEGVVRLPGSPPCLRAEVAPIEAKLLKSQPKIGYFVKKNSGWQKGDELVCVGVLNRPMVLRFGAKVLRKTLLRARSLLFL